ncbi:MAG: Gfo/Idh/MocA family oxidoreductase [Saprospiraceae bacterium]|nr:Gfo/Idh/MocA family oxidoreductase [Saprospiraceae bacterium]
MSDKLKVGIIGFGNIGKKHARSLALTETAELAAIYDPNEDISFPGITICNSIEELLADGKIDIVSVCTPNFLHEEHSIQALQAGHHVICEKPFALTSLSCSNIIAASKKFNKRVFCVMQNRFSPVSQWLQDLIAKQWLGEIYMVNVACYWNRNDAYYKRSDWRGNAQKDGGTLFTQFSHYVDTLYWLFGDINIENAIFANNNHDSIDFEDSCSFNFRFKNNGLGNFSYTTSTFENNFESTLTIIAEKGTIKVAGQYMNEVEFINTNGLAPVVPSKTSDNIMNLSRVYQNACASIFEGLPPSTGPDDGLAVVKIIEDVYSFKK